MTLLAPPPRATLVRPRRRTVEWLPSAEAAEVRGVSRPYLCRLYAAGAEHAHWSLRGCPAGQWWATRAVARAARDGKSLARQRAICGCLEPGWSPPPATAGRARRRRRP